MEKENSKKGGNAFRNMSTWAVVIFFVVICAAVTVVIGIYSMKKQKEKEASTTQSANVSTEAENGTGESQEPQGTSNPQGTENTEAVVADGGNGTLKVTVRKSNEWGDEENQTAQYDVYIRNTSGADVTDWTLKLQFADSAVYSEQSWGAEIDMKNGVLSAVPVDYTKWIAAGQEVSFGVQITNAGTCEVLEVTNK